MVLPGSLMVLQASLRPSDVANRFYEFMRPYKRLSYGKNRHNDALTGSQRVLPGSLIVL